VIPLLEARTGLVRQMATREGGEGNCSGPWGEGRAIHFEGERDAR